MTSVFSRATGRVVGFCQVTADRSVNYSGVFQFPGLEVTLVGSGGVVTSWLI